MTVIELQLRIIQRRHGSGYNVSAFSSSDMDDSWTHTVSWRRLVEEDDYLWNWMLEQTVKYNGTIRDSDIGTAMKSQLIRTKTRPVHPTQGIGKTIWNPLRIPFRDHTCARSCDPISSKSNRSSKFVACSDTIIRQRRQHLFDLIFFLFLFFSKKRDTVLMCSRNEFHPWCVITVSRLWNAGRYMSSGLNISGICRSDWAHPWGRSRLEDTYVTHLQCYRHVFCLKKNIF